MSTLAIREAERAALSMRDRTLLACCSPDVIPGTGAPYFDESGVVVWAVFDSPGVALGDVALGGFIMGRLADVPVDPTGKKIEAITEELREWAEANGLVAPGQVPENPEGGDRVADVWAAQDPPEWGRMTREVPAGWAAVPPEL